MPAPGKRRKELGDAETGGARLSPADTDARAAFEGRALPVRVKAGDGASLLAPTADLASADRDWGAEAIATPGSGIGAKLPKEAIFDSIINPNAGLSMGFETTELTLRGNNAAMGIVRSETVQEIVLALPGGALQKFSTADIQRRNKLTTSMMPSGLNQALTQKDLVDLVEYLSTQKAVK